LGTVQQTNNSTKRYINCDRYFNITYFSIFWLTLSASATKSLMIYLTLASNDVAWK